MSELHEDTRALVRAFREHELAMSETRASNLKLRVLSATSAAATAAASASVAASANAASLTVERAASTAATSTKCALFTSVAPAHASAGVFVKSLLALSVLAAAAGVMQRVHIDASSQTQRAPVVESTAPKSLPAPPTEPPLPAARRELAPEPLRTASEAPELEPRAGEASTEARTPNFAARPRTSDISREAALLRRALVSAQEGRSTDAFDALAAHRARFARGALAKEREALWLRLRCTEDAAQGHCPGRQ